MDSLERFFPCQTTSTLRAAINPFIVSSYSVLPADNETRESFNRQSAKLEWDLHHLIERLPLKPVTQFVSHLQIGNQTFLGLPSAASYRVLLPELFLSIGVFSTCSLQAYKENTQILTKLWTASRWSTSIDRSREVRAKLEAAVSKVSWEKNSPINIYNVQEANTQFADFSDKMPPPNLQDKTRSRLKLFLIFSLLWPLWYISVSI